MEYTDKKRKRLAGLLTALTLAFIWGNSLLSGADSSAVSGFAGELLAKLFGPAMLVATPLIRKLGHFTEFLLLGLLLSWNRRLWNIRSAAVPVLAGLLVALTDETIQIFTPGRASMVADVWIDFAGVLTGALLFRLLLGKKKS